MFKKFVLGAVCVAPVTPLMGCGKKEPSMGGKSEAEVQAELKVKVEEAQKALHKKK
jgi:hypothetical protein